MGEAFANAGLRVDATGELTVVVTDDYLHPDLATINREHLESGRAWLLTRPLGLSAWIGPLFLPKQTGCWRCLAHRLEGHRRVERYLEHRASAQGRRVYPPARAATASSRCAVAALVADAGARWAAEGRVPHLEGRVVTFGVATLESQSHVLVRRPQCPACGDRSLVARMQAEPLVIEASAARAFALDGGPQGNRSPKTRSRDSPTT